MKTQITILIIAALMPACSNMTPDQQALLTRITDKALAIGEAKLDKELGLPPAAVVTPNKAPDFKVPTPPFSPSK